MGRLLGGEHDSTPQSGVEAPRLLKNGASPYCIIVVVVGVVVVVVVVVVSEADSRSLDVCVNKRLRTAFPRR